MTGIQPYVLVVDDDRDTAESMACLLKLWGYEAEGFYCGDSALEAARRKSPTVVILDLGMAPMDGFDFAARLREVPGCRRTKLVVLSGHCSSAFRTRCEKLGVVEYCTKPAQPSLLRELVGSLAWEILPAAAGTRRLRSGRRVFESISGHAYCETLSVASSHSWEVR